MNYDTIGDAVTMQGNVEGTLLAGRYRVVRQLGQGGMGSVWLAEDTQLDNKQFAVKMLPSILVSNKRAYRQLKDEALVAMQLVHPNIVQIRAFEENNGNPFLVMDYIDGGTLDDYLADKGKLSEDEAVRILKPIAAALDYAHTKGVVHRDVKPGNVMIAKDGTPYILDFGIAREIQETMTRVTGKLSSGTLLYMSPEQLNGDAPKPAQDIYSFAAMVYECLKGEPPFVRGAIDDQIKNKQPEQLTGNVGILAAGVMSGLAKKPEDRPATCTGVLELGEIVRSREEAEEAERKVAALKKRLEREEAERRALAVALAKKTEDRLAAAQEGKAKIPCGGAETQRKGGAGKVLASLAFIAAIGVGGLVYHQNQERRQADQTRQEAERRAKTLKAEDEYRLSPSAKVDVKSDSNRKSYEDSRHKGVQLWENGPCWADRNIGAENPEDYGLYFWWGDTTGHRPSGHAFDFDFSRRNSVIYTCGKSVEELQSTGWVTGSGVLAPEHDAAHVHWGGDWRMPTQQEIKDLSSKCVWEWKPVNGVKGYEVRGKGAYAFNSIFLPCSGYGDGTSLYGSGSGGYYWSSVPYSDYYVACVLYFYSGDHCTGYYDRYFGQSVRPVQGFTK